MENTDAMLKKTIDEIKESKKIIQDLHNEINAAYDPTLLKLGEMIKGIRAKRQTVVMELRQSLSAMKDVRSFFLDKDYKQEMDRLERFVILGERLKKLIDDGTLDAVCDAALKLAVPEEGEKL